MRRLRGICLFAAAVLTTVTGTTACGSQHSERPNDRPPAQPATLNVQQATQRAEHIVHQAVDGMSPEPVLKGTGLQRVGPCLADDHSTGERVQVRITYRLTEVPGKAAKKLVHQARDSWVQRGYEFQGSDADWSDPFPSVSMRTTPDEF